MTKMRAVNSAVRLFSLLILLTLAFIPLIRVFILKVDGYQYLFNSDVVHPFLLTSDLMDDFNAWFTWIHSPSFYIVPDLILAAGLGVARISPFWQPIVYSSIIVALQCLSAGAILQTARLTTVAKGAWLYAASLGAFAGVIAVFNERALSLKLLMSSIAAYTHSGALLMTMASLALFLASLREPRSARIQASLALIVVASTFSDILYAVWFSAPAFAVAVLFGFSCREKAAYRLATVIALSTGVTLAIETGLNESRSGYLAGLSVGEMLDFATLHADIILPLLLSPLFLAFVFLNFLVAGRCAWLAIAAVRHRKMPLVHALELFLGGSAVAAAIAPIAIGQITSPDSARFFQPIMACLFLWMIVHAMSRFDWVRQLKSVAIAAPVLLAAVPAAILSFRLPPPAMPLHAALVQCLEREGRHAGLARYWNAMATMHLSGRKLQVVSAFSDLGVDAWNINMDWYDRYALDGSPVSFDFIVPDQLDSGEIRKQAGDPERILDCAGNEVWLYDKPLTLKRLDRQ